MRKLFIVLAVVAVLLLASSAFAQNAECQYCAQGTCLNVDSLHQNGGWACKEPCKIIRMDCHWNTDPSIGPAPPTSRDGEAIGSVDVPMSMGPVCKNYSDQAVMTLTDGSLE